jgi:hypothetical protein
LPQIVLVTTDELKRMEEVGLGREQIREPRRRRALSRCQRGRRALHEHTAAVTGCFAARQHKAAGTPGERGGGVRPALM